MADVILFSIIFWFLYILEVKGMHPQEFRSAGITLTHIIKSYGWLGFEELDFVGYHVRRTTVLTALHSLLPLCYLIGLQVLEPSINVLMPWKSVWYVQVVVAILLLSVGTGFSVSAWWYAGNYSNHPLIKELSSFDQPLHITRSSVNCEYRSLNKFLSILGSHSVVVTDTWIMRIGPHSVRVLRQYDAVLNVSKADEHILSVDGPTSAQYLTIEVISVNVKVKSFNIRLNALEYGQLKERVSAPLRTARSVIIQQSLSDQFVRAFQERVTENGNFSLSQGSQIPENCIGCLQIQSNIKLQKMCNDPEIGPCVQCSCRPLWCLSCMAKWFASRQDQNNPQTWMAGTAPCPMCRATFCVLDVLLVTR